MGILATSEQNTALARRWFDEVWNQRRIETIHEMLTDESICHSERGPIQGAQAFIDLGYTPFLQAFPDMQVRVEGTIAEHDQVVVRWRASATHTGEGFGMPPTGRRVNFRGMTWIRYAHGKMMEGWDVWNVNALVQTLQSGQAQASVELV